MKTLINVLLVLLVFSGTQLSQTYWYVNNTNGLDGGFSGLSMVQPFKTITHAANMSADGDIINIAGDTYIETPTITTNVTMKVYVDPTIGSNEVIINVSAGFMTFNMTDKIIFTSDISGCSFNFIGSATAGINQVSGDVLILDVDFYLQPPFLWQGCPCTSIEDEIGISSKFELAQNYPNPFNPETNIRFGLPGESEVTLKIYNLLGEEVATLIQGFLPAGFHSVKFNASDLNSGIYIYRLIAGDFCENKKMMLIK